MSVAVAADAARPVVSISPAPDAAATALLPAPAAFVSIQHDFLMTLAPHKRPNTLVDASTYAAIRAVLRDGDLASSSAFSTWAYDTFRLDADAAYILHEDKRVARAEDLHMILCAAHTACGHSGLDATYKEVREHWRFVPKDLVARFVQACPTCMMKRMTSVQMTSTRARLPVPRVLISPVAEDGPPADRPCDPAVPLGSSTFELLTGFALPHRTMRPAPVCSSPAHHKSVDASAIPLDPALAMYSAPPSPLTLALSTTADPLPRPPRNPLRPTPLRLPTKSRMAPPLAIDVCAADASSPQYYDIDAATPVLSSAYTSTASEASLPSTPSADTKRKFVRSSRERVVIPSGSERGVMSGTNSTNTENAMCDEGIRQNARSRGGSPALSDTGASAEVIISPTPSSAASLWSQDSANFLLHDSWSEGQTAQKRNERHDVYDGDAEPEDGD